MSANTVTVAKNRALRRRWPASGERPPAIAFSEPEVGLPDARVVQKLGGGPRLDDAARFEDVAAVRVLEGDLDVLFHEEHGRAFPIDLGDEVEQAIHDERRKPERQLVDEEETRAAHEPAPDRAHLLLATGETSRELAGPLLEAREEREDAFKVLLDSLGVAAQVDALHEVFLHGQSREQAPALRHVDDARADHLFRACGRDVAACKAHRTAHRLQKAGDGPEERRLACAVRADQRDDLLVIYLEGDVPEDLDLAVAGGEAFHLQQRVSRRGRGCLPKRARLDEGALFSGGLRAAREALAEISLDDGRALDD